MSMVGLGVGTWKIVYIVSEWLNHWIEKWWLLKLCQGLFAYAVSPWQKLLLRVGALATLACLQRLDVYRCCGYNYMEYIARHPSYPPAILVLVGDGGQTVEGDVGAIVSLTTVYAKISGNFQTIGERMW